MGEGHGSGRSEGGPGEPTEERELSQAEKETIRSIDEWFGTVPPEDDTEP